MDNEYNNTIKDLSDITSIPYTLLCKLVNNLEDIICHDVKESLQESGTNSITEVNIGIGKLFIYITEEEVTYRFIPSFSFENKLVNMINNNEDPMITELEESLKEKIVNRYKDLF